MSLAHPIAPFLVSFLVVTPVPVLVVLSAGAVAGLGGLLVPTMIRRLPEPEPEPPADVDVDPDPPEGSTEKTSYLDIAATPRLALLAAAIAAVAAALIALRLGADARLLVLVPLVPVGVALAVVDVRTRLLPTRLIAPAYVGVLLALVVVALLTWAGDVLLLAGAGWLVYGGLFWVLWWLWPAGLGYGDVRLAGLLGLALGPSGWIALLLGIWSASLIGGVGGLLLRRWRPTADRHLPYGPAMLLGALVGILLG